MPDVRLRPGIGAGAFVAEIQQTSDITYRIFDYNRKDKDGKSRELHTSKYPVIAKDYFYNKKHQTVDIIKLNGSVELGPIVGLSDVIVDIVETGSTLRENGLGVLEEICELSARVIVNQVSMQMESERIREIILRLRKQLEEA